MERDGTLRALAPSQVEAYSQDGFLFPIPLFTPEEALELRTELEGVEAAELERRGGEWTGRDREFEGPQEHPLHEWIDSLIRDPRILDVLEDLIGPNILVRNFDLFAKEPGGNNGLGWHIDSNYNGDEPMGVVTVWIALTRSYDGNGGMWFVPGSHRRAGTPEGEQEDFNAVAESAGGHVEVTLSPGEVSIHHHRVLHRSGRNPAKDRRIGLAIRYMSTEMNPEVTCSGAGVIVRGSLTGGRYEFYEREAPPFTWWQGRPRASFKKRSGGPSSSLRGRLQSIAKNLAWSWKPDARALLQDMTGEAWENASGNPVQALRNVSDAALSEWFHDSVNEKRVQRFEREHEPGARSGSVVYLSMEYGLHEHLPIYSGGLGVLAGDHLKAASDQNLSVTGIGLLYREGYFQQGVSPEGEQTVSNRPFALRDAPASPVVDKTRAMRTIRIPIGDREVLAALWKIRIGRGDLWLLDTDVEENSEEDRALSARLYSGDEKHRIDQEVLLGRGAVELVRSVLGISDPVYHLNEGHCGFAQLDRIHRLVVEGVAVDEAIEEVKARTVFTTHTPVPAGNEVFRTAWVDEALTSIRTDLGADWDQVRGLGMTSDDSEGFSMTVLGLRTARAANGVSLLHGRVAREMWAHLWPGKSPEDVPIGSITNGVHAPTWVGDPIRSLLEQDGPLHSISGSVECWERLREVDDAALWTAHLEQKRALAALVLERTGKVLGMETLVMGFARRFATYKRATLLLRDPEALHALLFDGPVPVSLLFAGKAHAADKPGQAFIAEVIALSRDPRFEGRIFFLKDYDMRLGRVMTRGSDLWLSTSRRRHEASGTSGMKALLNGVLNCAVLDGWWDEAHAPELGWAIGGDVTGDVEQQDTVDHRDLLRLLNEEVLPLFADRNADGIPTGWVERMREAMVRHGAFFTSARMVQEYSRQLYATTGH